MEYPKLVLTDLYWAFNIDRFDDRAAFEQKLKTYYEEIAEEPFKAEWQQEVLDFGRVLISFEYYHEEEEDDIEQSFEIKSENGTSFKGTELLYLINQRVHTDLVDSDDVYFEGLMFLGEEAAEDGKTIPCYAILLGS